MKIKYCFSVLVFIATISFATFGQDYSVYNGQELGVGLDMGVDTNNGLRDWVTDMNGYQRIVYPPNQTWGAVFVTAGEPRNPPRPFMNFSGYSTLSVEMKGLDGGENVEIGIKDNTDPDNGRETKISITLSQDWDTFEFPLIDFETADPSHLYVLIEFVFGGPMERTVYFREIKYNR